jgi:AraC family transcriptional activator of pobA
MDGSVAGVNNSNMPQRSSAFSQGLPAQRMPAYALYGETAAAPAFDAVHAESIAARSQLHGWEIRPHRHENLFQLLVVRRGRVQVLMDGRSQALRGPALVTVPALTAHGFRFSADVDGWVFTQTDGHCRVLAAHAPGLVDILLQARATPLPARAAPVRALLAAARALHDEHQAQDRAFRTAALNAAWLRVAVSALRAWPAQAEATAAEASRAVAHVRRLRALVDAGFRQQPTLAALALQIGITPTQLNRACQQVLGHSASQVLHQRLLLEAQRDLAYTAMTVGEIAIDLGFCEAGYFTRFFRQRVGLTPGQWRLQAGLET